VLDTRGASGLRDQTKNSSFKSNFPAQIFTRRWVLVLVQVRGFGRAGSSR